MIELLQRLSLISYILAAVFFVISVILFFRLKVPTLIDELSGAAARRGVEEIKNRAAGAAIDGAPGGKSTERTAAKTKQQRGAKKSAEKTEKRKRNAEPTYSAQETAPLPTQQRPPRSAVETEKLETADLIADMEQTAPRVRAGSNETVELNMSNTQGVSAANETVRLYEQMNLAPPPIGETADSTIDAEMGFIGSDELIE